MTALRSWFERRSPATRIGAAATVLFGLIVCRWQPWTFFDRQGFSTNFYEAQARALWHLRLNVPAEVAGPEGFLIDGATYLYYGPMLAIVRMPFVLLGDWIDGRLVRISLVGAYATSLSATARFAAAMAARLGRSLSRRRMAWIVAVVAASPLLSMAGWDSVYHETELWAYALCLLTVSFILEFLESPSRRTLMWSAFGCAATVLTRASVGYGVAVAMVGASLWVARHSIRWAVAFVSSAATSVALNIGLNLAKFGTLLDLPADRQVLTLQVPARAAWFEGNGGSFFGLRFLPTTLLHYLRPDAVRFERLLPFVRFGPPARVVGSYPLEGNTPSTSLIVGAPLLVALGIAGVVLAVRLRAWWVIPLELGMAVAALPTLLIGFIAQRYLVDLMPVVVIPACVALVAVDRRGVWMRRVGALLIAWAALVGASLATWISELKEPGFTQLRYAVDDLLFNDAPPSVVRVVPGSRVPRDGVVGIAGDCDGLYIAEAGRWVPLERADGIRASRFVASQGRSTLTTTDGILDIIVAEGRATARWQTESAAIEGTPVAIEGQAADISIIADPLVDGFRVYADGELLLAAPEVPSLEQATLAGDAVAEAMHHPTSTCQSLLRRLAPA